MTNHTTIYVERHSTHVSAYLDAVIHLPLKDAVLLSIDKDNVVLVSMSNIAEVSASVLAEDVF